MNGTAAFGVDPGVMSSYNDRDAGCLLGSCLVQLKNGSSVTVDSLVKGDIVLTSIQSNESSFGPCYGRVICIVKSQVAKGYTEIVRLSDHCALTPWHPVRMRSCVPSSVIPCDRHNNTSRSKWEFPVTLKASETILCQYVYSLLIESIPTTFDTNTDNATDNLLYSETNTSTKYAQSIVVDVVYECITLAHGIYNDEVAEHDFFGTTNIVKSLSFCPGFTDGSVTLLSGWSIRDDSDNRVVGIDLRLASASESAVDDDDDTVTDKMIQSDDLLIMNYYL